MKNVYFDWFKQTYLIKTFFLKPSLSFSVVYGKDIKFLINLKKRKLKNKAFVEQRKRDV